MRVITLLARYGTTAYADALPRLDELFGRHVPGADRSTLVVDNALPSGHLERSGDRVTLIGGDNTWHEFSGWDRGLRFLGGELHHFDVVHLATSAFGMLYTAYLDRFDEDLLHLVAERPLAAGHVDYFPHPVRLGGYVAQHWLRTSFVFVAPRELAALRTLVSCTERKSLFSGNPASPFREDAWISPGYRKLILDWLTTDQGTGQGIAWHSRTELGPETLARIEDKTMDILNELGLSIRLRAQGCQAADLTYLSDPAKRKSAWDGSLPSWRRQVSERGAESHAFPLPRAVE